MPPFALVRGGHCLLLLAPRTSSGGDLGVGGTATVKCAKRLANEEPFERFFGEVFRHHAGQQTLGDGKRLVFMHTRGQSCCVP